MIFFMYDKLVNKDIHDYMFTSSRLHILFKVGDLKKILQISQENTSVRVSFTSVFLRNLQNF